MSASRPPRWAAAAERAGRACVAAALAAIGLAASVANAQRPPPPSALPRVTPIYSIAAGSPSPFLPSDILGPNRLTGSAGVLFPSAAFGLLPADDIDAIAYRRPNGYPMFFSVDRTSTGLPGPFPNDVVVQAGLDQAAGDIFMTAYPAFVPRPGLPFVGPSAGTNILVRNQNELGLIPAIDAGTPAVPPVAPPIDELDALEFVYFEDPPPTVAGLVYSLAPGSPTLALIGATPGDLITTIGGLPTIIPWFRQVVGLVPADDLDALVWDSETDAIGFSLARGSPSLATTPWGQFGQAASLFSVRPTGPGANQVFVALSDAFSGLAAADELDAAAFLKPPPPPPPPIPTLCDVQLQLAAGGIVGRDGFDIRGCPLTPAFVPEPAPVVLLGSALLVLTAGAGLARRRR